VNEIVAAADNVRDLFDFYVKAKLTAEEAIAVGDILTAEDPPEQGRINLSTAPREVMMCLPGMDQAKADAIVAARQNAVDRTNLLWVVEALGDQAVGIGRGDWVTGTSYQYSADILAVSLNGRAFRRCRVVVDTTGTMPRIIHRRDLTERGWPLDPGILESLRTGSGVPGSSQGTSMLTPMTGARF
jgi:hypothetical protein